jgi:hypothetical protein
VTTDHSSRGSRRENKRESGNNNFWNVAIERAF